MKQHKWANEIKAWANGATIQYKNGYSWLVIEHPNWNANHIEFRIKPQPKEQQYLYAYEYMETSIQFFKEFIKDDDDANNYFKYIGKIALIEDEK